jgi:hypothetical protein
VRATGIEGGGGGGGGGAAKFKKSYELRSSMVKDENF